MRYARFSVASALALAAVAASVSASGQDAPCAGADQVAVLERDGHAGVWVPSETSRCMLGRLRELPKYAQRVELLEERLRLSSDNEVLLERKAKLAEDGERAAESAVERAISLQHSAERDRDAWWRSPVLWTIVGVVAAVALEVVAVWALSEVAP